MLTRNANKNTPSDQGTWYQGFLEGVLNRKNCYACPYAQARRVSDVTMAGWPQIMVSPLVMLSFASAVPMSFVVSTV